MTPTRQDMPRPIIHVTESNPKDIIITWGDFESVCTVTDFPGYFGELKQGEFLTKLLAVQGLAPRGEIAKQVLDVVDRLYLEMGEYSYEILPFLSTMAFHVFAGRFDRDSFEAFIQHNQTAQRNGVGMDARQQEAIAAIAYYGQISAVVDPWLPETVAAGFLLRTRHMAGRGNFAEAVRCVRLAHEQAPNRKDIEVTRRRVEALAKARGFDVPKPVGVK